MAFDCHGDRAGVTLRLEQTSAHTRTYIKFELLFGVNIGQGHESIGGRRRSTSNTMSCRRKSADRKCTSGARRSAFCATTCVHRSRSAAAPVRYRRETSTAWCASRRRAAPRQARTKRRARRDARQPTEPNQCVERRPISFHHFLGEYRCAFLRRRICLRRVTPRLTGGGRQHRLKHDEQ